MRAHFVARMNQTAKDLGLNATYYNCHGAQPNYITARSQAKLTRRFIDDYPDILRITSKSGFNFNGSYYNNTNHRLNTMAPYEGLDGFKTGTIAEAGYCVTTTAVRDGRRVIAVVMKSTSDAQRFADSRQLDYGFAEIQKRDAARKRPVCSFTAAPDSVRPYQPFTVTARLEGVSASYACKAQWYVNGAAVDGYGNSSFLTADYKTSTLQYTLKDLSGDTLDIAFVLTMFDGTEIRCETALPVEQRPVEYGGSLNHPARGILSRQKRCSLPRISPAKKRDRPRPASGALAMGRRGHRRLFQRGVYHRKRCRVQRVSAPHSGRRLRGQP